MNAIITIIFLYIFNGINANLTSEKIKNSNSDIENINNNNKNSVEGIFESYFFFQNVIILLLFLFVLVNNLETVYLKIVYYLLKKKYNIIHLIFQYFNNLLILDLKLKLP